MPRSKKHSAEQIIAKLRTAEVEISKGRTTAQAAKKMVSPSRRTTVGARSMEVYVPTRPSV